MKKPFPANSHFLALGLVASGLVASVCLKPVLAAPQAGGAAPAPVVNPQEPATAPNTEYTPSEHTGVVVRHIPAPEVVQAPTTGGVILKNERPAPGGGTMADVDFSSLPADVYEKSPKKKMKKAEKNKKVASKKVPLSKIDRKRASHS